MTGPEGSDDVHGRIENQWNLMYYPFFKVGM
jgi:hypothetical protein